MRRIKNFSFVSTMYRSALIVVLALVFCQQLAAQDTLPKVSVTLISDKVLVSWTNRFSNITNIGIQRSYDSLKNFTTIGSVLNVKAESNGFVDQKTFSPSQFYRLFISFEGGSYIFSESHRPVLDTSATVPQVVETGRTVQTWFVPSKHIYTGRDANVIISLPDYDNKRYSIKFFEDDNTFLFEIKKVMEPYLTLDKVNFLHAGLFRFELFENGVITERHKLYIPKDGKPIPAMNEQGYELR